MDKYQEYLMNAHCSYYGFAIGGKIVNWEILQNERIVLKQNEDISIKNYYLYIANKTFDAVFAIKNGKETSLKQEHDPEYSSPKSGNQNRFLLPIDFDDKIDEIKIVFKNNLADDLIIPVIYEEADKKAYYAKQEKKRRDDLLAAADIKCSTGAALVNVYFQPCSKDYCRTEITLFRDNKVLAKYKVDGDCFFKSISGLAYGKYSFSLKQYDKTGNTLVDSEQVFFTIHETGGPQRPVIYNR